MPFRSTESPKFTLSEREKILQLTSSPVFEKLVEGIEHVAPDGHSRNIPMELVCENPDWEKAFLLTYREWATSSWANPADKETLGGYSRNKVHLLKEDGVVKIQMSVTNDTIFVESAESLKGVTAVAGPGDYIYRFMGAVATNYEAIQAEYRQKGR